MNKTTWMMSMALVSGLAWGGCASNKETTKETVRTESETQTETQMEGQAQQPQARTGMPGNAPGDCPMVVEGATVRAENTADGAALVFTTMGDVQDLQMRVMKLAETHNRMTMNAKGSQQRAMMPETTARVEQMESGARLVFTPTNPSDLNEVRDRVQMRADNAHPGECPMLMGPGTAAG